MSKKKNISDHITSQSLPSYETVSGSIRFTLTNDYMFHIVFEKNKAALIKLIASLFHMSTDEIISLEVMNPIDYGAAINEKMIILDLKLLMNGCRIVNIEMQVVNTGNWPYRSVLYLCRCYDNVLKGNDYDTIMPTRQISIIDFDLPETGPEFYSTHHFSNDRTGNIFVDNFELSVLNLTQTDNATDDDKTWQIDQWAKLFKATTWEELRMIAAQDKEMTNVAKTLLEMNEDLYARAWAHSREMAIFDARCLKAQKKKALDELENATKELENTTKELENTNRELENTNRELESTNKVLESTNKELENTNRELESTNREVDRLRAKLIANGINPDD